MNTVGKQQKQWYLEKDMALSISIKSALNLVASSLSLLILILATSNAAQASSGLMTYKCGGYKAIIDNRNEVLLASILPYKGTWKEIPQNDPSGDSISVFFLHLETGKIAEFRVSLPDNGITLIIYRDVPSYQKYIPQLVTQCKRGHVG